MDAPRSYRSAVAFFRFVVRRWFRRVEVTGLEHLPADGGGILVAWHPNGMIDPGLIVTHFPQQVSIGARDGLFRVPLLGTLMRWLGCVPIFRAMDHAALDPEARRHANEKSVDALAEAVAAGAYACLFPEGDSHDAPHLRDLKTGAARLYYRVRQLGVEPVIVPVGLHYAHKRSFRSSALVAIHPPISLPELLAASPPDEPPEEARSRYRQLTDEIERVLREVVHCTESWELHYLMHRGRKLVRAERACQAGSSLAKPAMTERILGFARVWTGYYARLASHPDEVARLERRVAEYDRDLRALGIEDHELDRSPRLASPWLLIGLLSQALLVFLFLPPILLFGYLINGPAALALWGAAKLFSKKKKDEASIKVLLGLVLLPLGWLTAGALAYWGSERLHQLFPGLPSTPWPGALAALAAVVLGIVGGILVLAYHSIAAETLRALRVRLTRTRRARTLARLRRERRSIYEAFMGLAAGLDLPGEVAEDGRVRIG